MATSPRGLRTVDFLFQAARRLDPAAQASFLDENCVGNEALRQEVEKLLGEAEPMTQTLGGEGEAAAGLAEPLPVFSARFDVVRRAGEGGMGLVCEAWDKQRSVRVALKTLTGFTADALYLFKNEFRSLTNISHPNLVPLYELFSEGGRWFFSMEYIEGAHFLEYVRPQGNGCDFERLRMCLAQLAGAVLALHAAGILHRDLKSTNVKVTPEGRVVVLDFGLAVHREPHFGESTGSDGLRGTVPYISPEHLAGLRVAEPSDWYAIGVMLFEALTGRYPFEGSARGVLQDKQRVDARRASEIATQVPDDLDAICAGLLMRDPGQRLTGQEMLASLQPQGSEGRSGAAVRVARGDQMFVGREPQLAALEKNFAELERGEPSLALVHGPSGIGKSALMEHFLSGLANRGDVVVLSGRCYEQESVPYKALDGAIDSLGRYLGCLPRLEAGEIAPRDASALTQIFPTLRHVQALSDAPSRHGRLDQQELRRKAFGALRELLARLGDRRRVVLFIDDLQWGDLDSAALLREILRAPDSPALMLILSYRTEDQDCACVQKLRELDVPLRAELQLSPLDREVALQLAGNLLSHDDPAWMARAESIARECAGNPYLALELAQQEAQLAGSVSLDDMLWTRFEALPGDARDFLEVVAVAGRSISEKDAFDAAGFEAQNPGVISLLRGNRLVRAASAIPGGIETYHDRIRETVTARIPQQRLKDRHLRVAVALERSAAADPEQLARHFDEAGEAGRAFRYYLEAGRLAGSALAFDQAARLYARSLELVSAGGGGEGESRREILAALARSLANAGRGREAADHFLLAACETSDRLEAIRLRQQAAYQYCIGGHLEQGREVFREVLQAVGQKLPPEGMALLPKLVWSDLRMRLADLDPQRKKTVSSELQARTDTLWFAATGFGMVDLIGGAYFADRAAIEALRCGDHERMLRALAWRACVVGNRGQSTAGEVERLLKACRAILDQHPSPYGEAMLEMAIGITNSHLGHRREVMQHLQAAEEQFVSKCPGTHWERTTTRFFICTSLLNSCQMPDLEQRVNLLLSDARERGDRFTYAIIASFVADIPLLARDRPAEARSSVAEAIAGWRQPGVTSPRIYASWSLHRIDTYAGESSFQMKDLEGLMEEARGSLIPRVASFKMGFLAIRSRLALGLAARGVARDSNLALAEREARRLLKMNFTVGKGFGLNLLAGVQGMRGDRAGALDSLRKSVELFEVSGQDIYGTSALLRRGQIMEGAQGQEMERTAVARLRAGGVLDPYRFTTVWIPAMDDLIARPADRVV
jgi:tetratricopeptide (TPR) repeat protein